MNMEMMSGIVAVMLLALAAVTGAARVIRIPRLGTGVRAALAAAAVACVGLTVMPPTAAFVVVTPLLRGRSGYYILPSG